VNLARAIYADKSIYLLDDPLASVDVILAKEIFANCIKAHLKEKTVILITNAVQFLEECNDIIFMKDGQIAEHGSHEQLILRKSHYFNMLQYHNQKSSGGGGEEESLPLISNETIQQLQSSSPTKKAKTSLPVETFSQKIIQDDSSYKFAGIKSYLRYLKAAGGYTLFGILMSFFITFGVMKQLASIWLQRWLDAGDGRVVSI
jgi:ABC-type multidrug transport system ATPase subunit